MAKKKVGVIFGGRSGEHTVSLQSAASVMEAIDKVKYDLVPIGITQGGSWIVGKDPWTTLSENKPKTDCFRATVMTDPSNPGILAMKWSNNHWEIKDFISLDVIFPVLHGPFGEDGTLQGLLDMAGIPYVGSGVRGSAVGMDKVIMKQIFQQTGLPIGEYLSFKRHDWDGHEEYWKNQTEKKLGLPCFVKPANLGSSVGISKANSRDQLSEAVKEAFLHDEKVIVEALILGREIECSVLGSRAPQASLPGEVVPSNEFYDYRAKYIDNRSELIIPAHLPEHLISRVQELSVSSFKAIDGSGLARVDFFVDPENENVVVNEINTLPGFTSISMYPKLWEASGLSYRDLIDQLIQIAISNHENND